MKKTIFALSAMAALLLTACSNEEADIFDQSAAERLNSVSGIYSQRLTASPGGWVMEYYPYNDNENLLTGIGYLIMNRFHDNGAVFTLMKNAASYNYVWSDSSAWQVVTDMGPVLSFNTFNECYGRFADPNDIDLTTGRNEDESGKGFGGDYEFVMVDVPEDGMHIMLKGRKRGLYQRLTRVPEGTDFEAYLDDIAQFNSTHFIKDAPWELVMTEGGKRYSMNWMFRGYATTYPEGTDSTTYGWHEPFLVTKYDDAYHLRFKDTLMVDDHQMEQEFVYSAEDDKFYGMKDRNNTIEGANPTSHFVDYMLKGHNWRFSSDGNVTGPLAEQFKIIYNDFAAHNYTIRYIQFSSLGGDGRVSVALRSGAKNAEIIYLYDMIVNEDGSYTISYREPYVSNSNKQASQILGTISTLPAFLESANGTYTAEQATGTLFNLSSLRLTSSNGSTVLVQQAK